MLLSLAVIVGMTGSIHADEPIKQAIVLKRMKIVLVNQSAIPVTGVSFAATIDGQIQMLHTGVALAPGSSAGGAFVVSYDKKQFYGQFYAQPFMWQCRKDVDTLPAQVVFTLNADRTASCTAQ